MIQCIKLETTDDLDRLSYEAYLSRIPNTERIKYALRKRCDKCHSPMPDSISVCHNCHKTITDITPPAIQHVSNHRESEAHLSLKEIGKAFLRELGYDDIETEHRFGTGRGTIKVDVFGVKTQTGEMAVVECGGCSENNLNSVLSFVPTVYTLPYGHKHPYKWNPRYHVCHTCGHIIGYSHH